MKNYKIVQEVRGVMTRFEPLTVEALSTATQDTVTLPELEAVLESLGLSSMTPPGNASAHSMLITSAACIWSSI